MPSPLRNVVWLACVCLLLCGRVASATDFRIGADLDGDGKRDRVTLDRARPNVLNVWLSASQQTWTVHSQTPIVRVAVSDLDGDSRPELIARGKGADLTVWTKRKHKGFRTFRPRRTESASIAHGARHAVHEDSSESSDGAPSAGSASLGLLLASRPRAPARFVSRALIPPVVAPSRSLVLDVSAPRPPPAIS